MQTLTAPRSAQPAASPVRSVPDQHSRWPELLAASLSLLGVLASLFDGLSMRTFEIAASDFKTLYASAWCYAHGFDPYSIPNIRSVFIANQVVQPARWWGHAPVYPPFTLALLAPLTVFGMVAAAWIWLSISLIVMAFAIEALTRIARDSFGLGRGWRMLLIALCAAFPLLPVGLELDNVSILCSALCILAVAGDLYRQLWWRSGALAFALLLKPHLALWVVIALFLLPEKPTRHLALRASAIVACAVACFSVASLAHQTLAFQWTSYRQIVASELSGGSMDPRNREAVGVGTQLTSIHFLAGYWLRKTASLLTLDVIPDVILGSFALALAWATRRIRPSAQLRLLPIAAWITLGLLATYHRAHDGVLLLILLPWLLAMLRTAWRSTAPWLVAAGMLFLAVQTESPWLESAALTTGKHGLSLLCAQAASLLLYRQAPLAALFLLLTLSAIIIRASRLSAERQTFTVLPTPSRTLETQIF